MLHAGCCQPARRPRCATAAATALRGRQARLSGAARQRAARQARTAVRTGREGTVGRGNSSRTCARKLGHPAPGCYTSRGPSLRGGPQVSVAAIAVSLGDVAHLGAHRAAAGGAARRLEVCALALHQDRRESHRQPSVRPKCGTCNSSRGSSCAGPCLALGNRRVQQHTRLGSATSSASATTTTAATQEAISAVKGAAANGAATAAAAAAVKAAAA